MDESRKIVPISLWEMGRWINLVRMNSRNVVQLLSGTDSPGELEFG
jgi:hypothetical protein